ncbi:MAG: hypothetical protein JWO26_3386 [Rhodospirillales bacterium]|nr:hypothetical protein [Rhodospirillales bacterium]
MLFLGSGLVTGWFVNGMSGLVVGGVVSGTVALLALFVPPVLGVLGGILEILSYCAF